MSDLLAKINILTDDQIRMLIEGSVEMVMQKLEKDKKVANDEEEEVFYTPQQIVEFHPKYNSDHWIRKIRKLIKDGELGQLNRFNKPTVTKEQMKKFLYRQNAKPSKK